MDTKKLLKKRDKKLRKKEQKKAQEAAAAVEEGSDSHQESASAQESGPSDTEHHEPKADTVKIENENTEKSTNLKPPGADCKSFIRVYP